MSAKINYISIALCLALAPIYASNVIAHPHHGGVNHHSISSTKVITQVKISTTDSALTTISTEVAAGAVEFIVSNQGKVPHEMVVLKLSQPIDKLPMKGNRLDEKRSGKKIGEIESSELASGATHRLMTKLTPGQYLLFSNVPGDYLAGMKVLLTVK